MPQRHFDLNVKKVLEDWTIQDALRELIANALDETALTGCDAIALESTADDTVVVRDFGRGLQIHHLTQNENSEKLDADEAVVGRFGVGLKDAIATLHRHGVSVRIESRHATLSLVETVKHGFDDIVTLHVAVADGGDLSGTKISLAPVSQADLDEARSLFRAFRDDTVLEHTALGDILEREPSGPARIYVKGVLAAEEPDFLFSYDIRSLNADMRRALNRERRSIGRAAYSERVKAMLLKATNDQVLAHLASQIVRGTEGELQWISVAQRAMEVSSRREQVIFATVEDIDRGIDEIRQAKEEGVTVVAVAERWRDMLEGDRSAGISTLSSFLQQKQATFEYRYVETRQLKKSEREILGFADSIAEAANVLAPLPHIRIVESFGPSNPWVKGLWVSERHEVLIRRDQLADASAFASILLHELAHWVSGAADCTREFESVLHAFAGRAAWRVVRSAGPPSLDLERKRPKSSPKKRKPSTPKPPRRFEVVTRVLPNSKTPGVTVSSFKALTSQRAGQWRTEVDLQLQLTQPPTFDHRSLVARLLLYAKGDQKTATHDAELKWRDEGLALSTCEVASRKRPTVARMIPWVNA